MTGIAVVLHRGTAPKTLSVAAPVLGSAGEAMGAVTVIAQGFGASALALTSPVRATASAISRALRAQAVRPSGSGVVLPQLGTPNEPQPAFHDQIAMPPLPGGCIIVQGLPLPELITMSGVVSVELRDEVLAANLEIPRAGLATLTWGNVSGVNRDAGVFVIKPSGVTYPSLTADHLVVVDLESGKVVEGHLRPSVDTETHRSLYQAFPSIGGVTHTHSRYAVAFSQARRDIPVLGTTHADTFNGPIRCTGELTPEQCRTDYEYNTGEAIVALLGADDAVAAEVPGALVANHGPFTWGASATKSLQHAIICEAVAEMALLTLALNASADAPAHLLERHYTRKHGGNAYYGNPTVG